MDYVTFFEGRTTDDKGRTITDILQYNTVRLECLHDYIQRIFPLQEASKFSDAQQITDSEIDAIAKSKAARTNIQALYQKMLQFWKIDDERIARWGKLTPMRLWNMPNNHNHLRMTRVLKSLKLLRMEQEYMDFSNRISCLLSMHKVGLAHISKKTANIWAENICTATHLESDAWKGGKDASQ